MTEKTRVAYGLSELAGQVQKVCPPGTKHLKGLTFAPATWRSLRDSGERVWLFRPSANDSSEEVQRYTTEGKRLSVDKAYKCAIRNPWWRPPAVTPPDLFFTYMSHRYPRLIANTAKTTFVNSMHGVRLRETAPAGSRDALPVLAFNSVTMLGAEVFGRSYGGGILKMEPREAAVLPVPTFDAMEKAWGVLSADRRSLDHSLQNGQWTNVVKRVDEVLLIETLNLTRAQVADLHDAARTLRARRMGKGSE